MDMMMKTSSDMTSMGQDQAQAFMKSGQIWATGCQSIGQSVAAAMQDHSEHMMATWKAMGDIRSFKDAMEMQASLMRTSVENAVASTGKFTGATMSLVEETMAPLTACMTSATEKFTIKAG